MPDSAKWAAPKESSFCTNNSFLSLTLFIPIAFILLQEFESAFFIIEMVENGVVRLPLCILLLCVCFAAICLVQCDATRTIHQYQAGGRRKIHSMKKLESSNTDPYVSSPFSLPPYESLPPFPSPENTPPYCVYPPSTLNPPSYTPIPNPPTIVPTPPAPTEPVFTPPYYEPSPPSYVPFPPSTGFVPSPKFLPPIVFPPPAVPPPPRRTPLTAMWCVAKAAVPDPIMQEAMDYACGSGADCDQLQPTGSCFMPNTLFAHASYAFNSYWQRTKVAGGKCDFGGTAILVTVDPSYGGCHFIYF
ncbi:Carbohydrate-binding X8 domain superfamily protein [Perilla frutescens var. frutescens]|nr:Carbohydrate-binding X8 domain superfamily protein [Perilla frutescens var. frutescens]